MSPCFVFFKSMEKKKNHHIWRERHKAFGPASLGAHTPLVSAHTGRGRQMGDAAAGQAPATQPKRDLGAEMSLTPEARRIDELLSVSGPPPPALLCRAPATLENPSAQ